MSKIGREIRRIEVPEPREEPAMPPVEAPAEPEKVPVPA